MPFQDQMKIKTDYSILQRYQQMYIYMCTILAYLRGSLTYMMQVSIHTMDYVDAALTNI